MSPKPHVVGVNHDRFFLKLSIADANYVTPDPDGGEFTDALLKIIKRERINVVMATNDNVVKVLSDDRRRYKIDLTDKDVDEQYADMAKRMHLTADQLTQTLGQNGVDAKTLKAKILASGLSTAQLVTTAWSRSSNTAV